MITYFNFCGVYNVYTNVYALQSVQTVMGTDVLPKFDLIG